MGKIRSGKQRIARALQHTIHKTSMEKIIERIKRHRPKAFKAQIVYSPEGDSLTFIFEDTEYYRERIDDFLTVYRAIEARDRLVGCQLKGGAEVLALLG